MDTQIQVEAMTLEMTIVDAVVTPKILFSAKIIPFGVVASPVSVISVGNASLHAIPAPNFDSRKDKLALATV